MFEKLQMMSKLQRQNINAHYHQQTINLPVMVHQDVTPLYPKRIWAIFVLKYKTRYIKNKAMGGRFIVESKY